MSNLDIDYILNNYTVFDYETKDPYIGKKMGGGWVYKINGYTKNNSFIVGLGIYTKDNACFCREAFLKSDKARICPDSANREVLIAHNLIYDLGWSLTKYNNKEDAIKELRARYDKGDILIDTKILARLVDEHGYNYSLATLAKKYKVTQKSTDLLADAVYDTGLYKELCSTDKRTMRVRPKDNKRLLKLAYENMHRLPVEVVQEYCMDDVKGTKELYEVLMSKLVDEYGEADLLKLIKTYSTLQYAVLEMRINGMTIDNDKLKENHLKLNRMLIEAQDKLNAMAGCMEVKVNATKSIVAALLCNGYRESDIPKTAAGNYSATQAWLEDQNSDLCKQIIKVRRLVKIISTFIESLRKIQDELELSEKRYGKVYGEFNIWGAHTGRFSASNPNLQQIPKRNPEFYEVCRSIFIAGPGMKFVAADYSNQEQRIQVHYGTALDVTGAHQVCDAWNADPYLDYHQKVADIVGLSRDDAKSINLGKSYGMGEAKLCNTLGLPTKKIRTRRGEMTVAGDAGKEIILKYDQLFPFIRESTDLCRIAQETRGYIKSLAGRHLHPEVYYDGQRRNVKYFKAFSQLIQGSAADQLIKTLVNFYENNLSGIYITGIVHDEILFTIEQDNVERTVQYINDVMTTSVKLKVPMIVDITVGDSWYESKEDKENDKA